MSIHQNFVCNHCGQTYAFGLRNLKSLLLEFGIEQSKVESLNDGDTIYVTNCDKCINDNSPAVEVYTRKANKD